MQLVIKQGKVIATHPDHVCLDGLYPGAFVIDYSGPSVRPGDDNPAPLLSKKKIISSVRQKRDRLLARSDWTQLLDAPLTGPQKAAWANYRQALRDLPEQVGTKKLHEVEWPTVPQIEKS